MKNRLSLFFLTSFFAATHIGAENYGDPIVDENVVFVEQNGIVMVEAEHFYKQTKTDVRKWYITDANKTPGVVPDPDPPHVEGTGNGAYIEALPDVRTTPEGPWIPGETIVNTPGIVAVLHYKIDFQTTGTYYVWMRAYSTGREDDAVHVGYDNSWPVSAQRWRTTIDHRWGWSKNRRKFSDPPYICTFEMNKTGVRDFQISMREDGSELDVFILTTSANYDPAKDELPSTSVRSSARKSKASAGAASMRMLGNLLELRTTHPQTQLEVFDLGGRLVHSTSLALGEHRVDLNSLKPGYYSAQIKYGSERLSWRVLKTR